MQIDDCATQRNLDGRGSARARAIGKALRAKDIKFDLVFTSQWCRKRETAEPLGLGPTTDAPVQSQRLVNFENIELIRYIYPARAANCSKPGQDFFKVAQ